MTDSPAIKLKGVLVRYGIRQGDVAQLLIQPHGRPISKAAMAMLVGHGVWPKLTSPDLIRQVVADHLRGAGVPDDELKTIWEPEDTKAFFFARPQAVKPHTDAHPAEIDPIGEPEMLHPETRKHFGLFKDPFKDDVQSAQDVFLSADQRYIREAMYTVAKHGGFLAVTGQSGSGKTTLFNDLYERIEADRARVIVATPSVVDVDLDTSKTRLTARRLLESILSAISSERPRQSMQRLTEQVKPLLRRPRRARVAIAWC